MRHQVFRPTGLEERAEIVWLWVEGWSVKAIAQHTGTSITTVYRWIRRWQKEGNVSDRPRSGRPRRAAQKMGNINGVVFMANAQGPTMENNSDAIVKYYYLWDIIKPLNYN
ncbi:hypothetical protein Pcinc_017006 [Petrolisthes cinctipes]|uniref:Transposase n=1 Tax=Petrolisthes cinctipes TaxID=88211 RepID=A0AAE1KP88_PETCI|nr:hypothetical protein Pcinc_017006 [Petrolisthes cinctipes]